MLLADVNEIRANNENVKKSFLLANTPARAAVIWKWLVLSVIFQSDWKLKTFLL